MTPDSTNQSPKTEPNFFDVVREQLRYWPYTQHQIEDTLDIGLIEGRGKQLLFRAINSRNLTAFAGSGLSMAYGRLSWQDWESQQQQVVERNANAFIALAEAALKWNEWLRNCVNPDLPAGSMPRDFLAVRQKILIDTKQSVGLGPLPQKDRHNIWRWLRSRHRAIEYALRQVQRLNNTFELAKKDGGDFPGGEPLPVKFEIAQQLHGLLQLHKDIFLPADLPSNYTDLKADTWAGAYAAYGNSGPIEALGRFKTVTDDLKKDSIPKGLGAEKCYKDARKMYFDAMSRPESFLSFERLAKAMLVDECPHAMLHLRNGFLKGRSEKDCPEDFEKVKQLEAALGLFDIDNHKRDIDGIRENPMRYRVLSPFEFTNFKKIRDADREETGADDFWKGFFSTVESKLEDNYGEAGSSGDKRIYLTPTSRFLVAVYLSLCADPIPSFGSSDLEKNPFFGVPDKKNFTSRRSILANRLDPLAKTEGLLGISRYITTNYDFEIERFYQDRGYRNFPTLEKPLSGLRYEKPSEDPEGFRKDGIGTRLMDQTFKRARPYELLCFALNENREEAGVFHLHGRATKHDPLVITERDYMNMFVTQDDKTDTVNESISAAFSGGPLLFLGLGMRETDLLRPLRQFVSNRDRTVGYTSIALLPAENALEARTKFASSLYLRYGVHTIFYGSGQIEIELKQGQKAQPCGIDWLHRILALKNALVKELKIWDGKNPTLAEVRTDEEILTEISDAVGEIGDDLADGDLYPPETLALNVLLGKIGSVLPPKFAEKLVEEHKAGKPSSEDSPGLKNCMFTPTRPHNDQRQGIHFDKNTFVDGEKYLGFYTSLLDKLFKMTLALPYVTSETLPATVASMKIALDGLHGAFLTGSLNAALESISREQMSWWEKWRESPPHRTPEFQRLPMPAPRKAQEGSLKWRELPFSKGTCYFRHRVDPVITLLKRAQKPAGGIEIIENDKKARQLKDNICTGVRAFDTFIVAAHDTLAEPQNNQRRIITVAARKGLGKGTFMSAFASPRGISLFELATRTQPSKAKRKLLASVFINLGFAPEISSCFDMLAAALIDVVAYISSKPKYPNYQFKIRDSLRKKTARYSRLLALKLLFSKFRNAVVDTKTNARILIVISPVDLLFDRNRNPKNGEIAELIKLLFSEELRDCPVDFVFIGDENKIGAPWSENADQKRELNAPALYRLRMDRLGLDDAAEEQIAQRMATGHIVLDEPPKERLTRLKAQTKLCDGHFIHVARPVSPVSVLTDNFPILAIGLYLTNPPETTTKLISDAPARYREAVATSSNASKRVTKRLWARTKLPSAEELLKLRRIMGNRPYNKTRSALIEHAKSAGYDKGDNSIESVLHWRLSDAKPTHGRQWDDVRHKLGDSRFTLTILLAAAEHLVVHADDPIKGAKDAEQFILNTADAVSGIGQARRDQMVLHAVLECYRKFQSIGNADLDQELHIIVIRHLGVIGAPTSTAVLVRLPEIRRYFERISIELPISRRRHLAYAMTVMAYRGLIFRVAPNHRLVMTAKTGDSWPATEDYRFSLHRVVQSYALNKLEASSGGSITANSFAPTIYAAMPSSGPTLSRDSYRVLRLLMIGLSQYPDVPEAEKGVETWLFTTKDRNVRIQALRCALTLARSTFSVAVISRLAGQRPIGKSSQKRGHLETYRVRLRWIIRLAWELMASSADDDNDHHQPDKETGSLNVLYRDEIVWLYNELGVISLAQGSLADSLGYLRQAAGFNEHIEGRLCNGPISNHIHVNHAVVQLERGRITSAQSRLDGVVRRTENGDQKLFWTAKGYLALLDHITGRHADLITRFEDVTKHFQENNETRAAAIFLGHRGRFLDSHDPDKAYECISRARDLAETGGHEDVRHHIELARVYVDLRKGNKAQFSTPSHLRTLREVEEYGRRMAIWSLQCDALRMRARILSEQGETTTAGRLLARAITIAQRNSMALRLNSAMTSYAETLFLRGDKEGAQRLARASMDKAKAIGYNLETPRIHRVLERIEG